MNITVLLFASAADAAGVSELCVALPAAGSMSSTELLAALRASTPIVTAGGAAFTPANPAAWEGVVAASVLAVNQEYVALDADTAVTPRDEVALIPPISGG